VTLFPVRKIDELDTQPVDHLVISTKRRTAVEFDASLEVRGFPRHSNTDDNIHQAVITPPKFE